MCSYTVQTLDAYLRRGAVLQAFPSEYDTAIRQAQLATKAALADGHKLLEVSVHESGSETEYCIQFIMRLQQEQRHTQHAAATGWPALQLASAI